MIDFKCTSTCQEFLYALNLGDCIHYTFICTFFVDLFFMGFFVRMTLLKMNMFQTDLFD